MYGPTISTYFEAITGHHLQCGTGLGLLEVGQRLGHLPLTLIVEGTGRLVQQENLGVPNEGPRDCGKVEG